jgi:predicted nucleotidyltransferase
MREADLAAIAATLRGQPGVKLALVFGSTARGTARADSDVDIAIDAEGDVDLLGLAARLTLTLGREVDLVAISDAGVPLLQELVRDGIVAHEGAYGAGARFFSRTLSDLEIDGPWYARMRDAWLRKVAESGLGNGQP